MRPPFHSPLSAGFLFVRVFSREIRKENPHAVYAASNDPGGQVDFPTRTAFPALSTLSLTLIAVVELKGPETIAQYSAFSTRNPKRQRRRLRKKFNVRFGFRRQAR